MLLFTTFTSCIFLNPLVIAAQFIVAISIHRWIENTSSQFYVTVLSIEGRCK
jgi:hypothetical protein